MSGIALPHPPGRPRGPRRRARERTRERLLDGALEAVARHGLSKLAMSDVSRYAGVSRGTAYRYFASTEALLAEVGRREAERFECRVWEALEAAPSGEHRLDLALDYMARLASESPLLQRLPDTDPAFVLTSIRDRFPDIRSAFARLLGPLVEETEPVRRGDADVDQLVGCLTRLLISAYLIPDPDPDRLATGLKAIYRGLATRPQDD